MYNAQILSYLFWRMIKINIFLRCFSLVLASTHFMKTNTFSVLQ